MTVAAPGSSLSTAGLEPTLEDALRMSSDWIAIREAALIELQRRALFTEDADPDVARRIALIKAWLPGAPPRNACGDLIIKSHVIAETTSHLVEIVEVRKNGAHRSLVERMRPHPFTIVIRATTGEVL